MRLNWHVIEFYSKSFEGEEAECMGVVGMEILNEIKHSLFVDSELAKSKIRNKEELSTLPETIYSQ